MKRIRHKLISWDEGRAFMNRLSDEIGESIEEIDADLRIENDNVYVNCHFDSREFSFILIKLDDDAMENRINTLISEFKAKK